MVSKKILAIVVAIVVVVAVGVAAFYLLQSLNASFAEAENSINSFLTSVNEYDIEASWNSMSSDLQSFYGSKSDWNISILDGLKQSSWQATLTHISSKSVKTNNGVTTATYVVTLQIIESGEDTRGETYTFNLVKMSDQWKIDYWREGVWD